MHTLLKLIGRTGIWKIQQGNWNAAPGKSPLLQKASPIHLLFTLGTENHRKTLIFLKQTAFQDYFEVQLEIFSDFCKVYFKIFLYGQANYQKKAFPGYHGYIITRDYQTQIMADGYTIEVVPIWKWLLQDNNQSFKEQKEILDKNRNFPFEKEIITDFFPFQKESLCLCDRVQVSTY